MKGYIIIAFTLFINITVIDAQQDYFTVLQIINGLNQKVSLAGKPYKEIIFEDRYTYSGWDTLQRNFYSYPGFNQVELIEQQYKQKELTNHLKYEYFGDYELQKFDSIKIHDWYNNQWYLGRYAIYGYKNDGNPDYFHLYSLNNGMWELNRIQSYFYNANDFLSGYSSYLNGVMEDSMKYVTDSIGRISEKHEFHHDGNGNWILQFKRFYKNYINNIPTEEILESWNGAFFEKNLKYNFNYTGNKTISYDVYGWTGSTWIPVSDFNAILNQNNYLFEIYRYPNGSSWDTSSYIIYEYTTDGNIDSFYSKVKKNGIWLNEEMRRYYYQPLNISEKEVNFNEIYPNPSDGVLNIKLTTKESNVRIFDILGNNVYSEFIKGTDHKQLQLDLAKGIYFMEITNPRGREVIKFNITK